MFLLIRFLVFWRLVPQEKLRQCRKKRKNETCRKECYRYAFPLLQSFCDFYRRQSKMGKASNEGLQIFQNNEDFEFNLKRLFFPSGVEGREFKSRRVHHLFFGSGRSFPPGGESGAETVPLCRSCLSANVAKERFLQISRKRHFIPCSSK